MSTVPPPWVPPPATPPHLPPLPPPPEVAATHEGGRPDDGSSAFAAARWLGVLGAGLVATASAIVGFTGRPLLGSLGPAIGLAGATACCGIAATRLRRAAPLVGRLIAHLGRLIGAVAGAATVAAFTPWPWVPATFGATLAATSVDWRLGAAWGRAGIHALAVGSVAVTVAATTPAPLGALLAAVAVMLVAAGERSRRAALERAGAIVGVLALAAPLGGLPGRWRLGDGTLSRLGLRGDVLVGAAPVAGLLGGAALLVVAARHRSVAASHVAMAGAALNIAVAAGWDDWDRLSATTVFCALFASAQLAIAAGRRDPFWRVTLQSPARIVFAAGCLLIVQVVVGDLGDALVHGQPDLSLTAAPLLLAVGMVLTRIDGMGRTGPQLAAAGLATVGVGVGAASLTAAAVAALGVVLCSLAARVAPIAAACLLAGSGVLAVSAQLVDGAVSADIVAAATVVVAGWAIGRRASTAETLAVVTGAVVACVASRPLAEWARPLVAAAAATGVAGAGLVASRRATVPVALAGPAATGIAATLSVIVSAGAGPDRASRFIAGCAALTAAAGAVALTSIAGRWRGDRRLDHAVAVSLTVVGVAGAVGAGVDTGVVVAAALLGGLAVGGAAFSQPRYGVADSAALAGLALAALFGSTGGESLLAWSAVVAVGIAVGLHGLCRLDLAMAVGGGAVSLIGAGGVAADVSAAHWLTERLHSLGLSSSDVAASALVAALAVGGATAAALRPALPSWWTWGPASALATGYLLTSIAVNGRPDTRVLVAITLSIGLVAAGAVRRAAAPLVIGTAATVGTVTLASWTTLTSLPVWTWIAVGGLALLSVAAVVERRGRQNPGDGTVENDRVVRRVLTTFR